MVYKRVSFKVFLLANVLSLALCQYKVSLAEGARFPFFCSPQQTVLTNSKGGQDKPGLSASLCLIYLNTDSLKYGDPTVYRTVPCWLCCPCLPTEQYAQNVILMVLGLPKRYAIKVV